MTRGHQRAAPDLADQRGFTLVELLVVLAAGLVVTSTVFAVLDVAIQQSTRVFSRVNATQQARNALERIEQQLHSSCIGKQIPPVKAGSDDNNLVFLTGYGASPSVIPEWHEITFTPNGTRGTLTESIYATTAPNWTRASLLGTNTLLENVAPRSGTPVFRYFAYEVARSSPGRTGIPYLDSSGNQYLMILDGDTSLPSGATLNGNPVPPDRIPENSPLPLTAPLTTNPGDSDATKAAAVQINLVVYPDPGSGVNPDIEGAAASVSDTVALRLTPIANNAGGQPNVSPCA